MKNKKYFIFVAVFLIAFAAAVSAVTVSYMKTIEVSTDINLSINGEAFTPKDAGGNPVEVFVYNGTTYVPIRAVSQAFGLEVSYDANTKTAIISEKSSETEEPISAENEAPPVETQPEDLEVNESAQIVYWVDAGEVWHVRISCSTLSRSKNIHSGTIEESGKPRVCKVCG